MASRVGHQTAAPALVVAARASEPFVAHRCHTLSAILRTLLDSDRKRMKDIVVVDIDAPRDDVVALYADPRNNTKWMEDINRCEPVSGEQGTPGSVYRLIPKRGSMHFIATVVSRNLPNELRLKLDSTTVAVDVRGRFSTLPNSRTRLVSEEVFNFKRVWNKVVGLLARSAIHKAHRNHIDAFKRFAERHA